MENEEEKERLAFENELKKAKLIAETGVKFGEFAKLPPELESQWLDNIAAFENAYQNSEMTTIREFIGNPEFKLPQELSDEEISIELERMSQLLANNGIKLGTICEVDEREIYRFMVEELLLKEIENVRAHGWVSHFTYEDYHPNHEYDIQRDVKDYLSTLFGGNKEFCTVTLAHEIVLPTGDALTIEAVKPYLEHFIDANAGAELEQLDFKENSIDEEGAYQKFYIRYKTRRPDSNEVVTLDGDGIFTFTYMYGYYYINGIDFPGFKV